LKEVNKKYIALQSAIIKVGKKVACEDYPDVFFPEDVGALTEAAKEMENIAIRMCRQCPVQKLCLDYAITAREPYGIWGGTLASER
jgi:WhiB family redox-sensing transcriptional regulator